jgi:hypothetical protein
MGGVTKGVVGGGIGTIIITLVALYFGVDPSVVLNQGGAPNVNAPSGQVSQQRPADEARSAELVSVVLKSTEDVWHEQFKTLKREYKEPKLVLFTGAVQSACGNAQSAMGPFYCPGDQKVYIDLQFYRDLKTRYRAPGEFAQAYVIAHEVGHHVQNRLGISQKAEALKKGASRPQVNNISVRIELQADCFAGVWGYHANKTKKILETGDIEAALRAASSIGDDRLQKQSRGYVVPDSFTHGSSEQRVRWFKKGIESGDLAQCNTFTTKSL